MRITFQFSDYLILSVIEELRKIIAPCSCIYIACVSSFLHLIYREDYDVPKEGPQEDIVRQTVTVAEEFLHILIIILSKYIKFIKFLIFVCTSWLYGTHYTVINPFKLRSTPSLPADLVGPYWPWPAVNEINYVIKE